MRLAVFADLHGNLPALEAVLADATRRGADALVHLGDLPGAGGRSGAVVRRIASEGIPGVRGDADEGAAGLGGDEEEFLRRLPVQFGIEEGGVRFLFAHENPWPRAVGPVFGGPAASLESLMRKAGVDVLVVGHTHRFGFLEVGGRVVLNPGSAGQPEDGSNRAPYLLLDTSEGLRASRACAEFHVESPCRGEVGFRA